ncbi:MAG: acyl-CoA thioesterase II [Deltaproteobacteria bacterium]|nr:acyl-CoA thioesterase II [Deltaproteobacteria bacterium]
MHTVLTELLDLLRLETIEQTVFRGRSQDLGWGRVFGGQVLGQALSAAAQTVPDARPVHSLHAYFLRPGDAKKPIVYMVDPIRDGRSFTTRRVVALQSGKAIFNLSASFQVEQEGFEHADACPEGLPGPEGLLSQSELSEEWTRGMPEAIRERAMATRPIEIRPIDPNNPRSPRTGLPQRRAWFRAIAALPDDPQIHRSLLAYASDFHFLTASLLPHGVSWLTPGIRMASLDHAMYFHRPFRLDDWLLYDVESPSASAARTLVRGRFFDRDGRLVASTVQEGMVRDRRDP